MANVTKIVEILFRGNDQVTKSAKIMAQGLDKVFSGIENVAAPISKITDSVLAVDAALVGLVAGGLASSISKFATFEDTMLAVKGIIGANADEYKTLSELTEKLGATTRFSATEAAEGLKFLAQAGLEVDEAGKALPGTLELAQAAFTDLGTTADIVTNIMSGYGKSAEDLGRLNDILTTTFTSSNVDLTELGKSFEYVGAVANAMGVPIEEVAAVIGKFGDAGIKGTTAGTSLRNVLGALAASTTNAGKLFKSLGIDTNELGIDLADAASALKSMGVETKTASGDLRPLSDIFSDLTEGLAKIPGRANQAATVMQIFGKRGGPQLQSLLIQGVDSLDKLENKIKTTSGITTKIAKEMESGFGGAIRSMISAFESLQIAVGKRIEFTALDSLTEVFRAIKKEFDAGTFDDILGILNGFGDEVSEVLESIAENIPEAFTGIDFSTLIDALRNLAKELGSTFDEVDLSTPEGLQDVVQNLINTLAGLTNVTTGIIQSFKPFFETIREAIQRVTELDEESQKSFGNLLGSAKLITKFGAEVGLAFLAIQKSGADIKDVFNIVIGEIKVLYNSVEIAINATVYAITEGLIQIVSFAEGVGKLLGPATEEFTKDAERMRKSLEDFQVTVRLTLDNDIKDYFDGGAQAISGFAGDANRASQELKTLNKNIEETPEKKDIEIGIEVSEEDKAEIEALLDEKPATKQIDIDIKALNAIRKAEEFEKILDEIPEEKKTDYVVDANAADVTFAKLNEQLDNLDVEKVVEIDVDAEDAKNELVLIQKTEIEPFNVSVIFDPNAKEDIVKYAGDAKEEAEKNSKVLFTLEVDNKTFKLTKEKIEELAKEEIKLKADLDIRKLEAEVRKVEVTAETVQKKWELNAELNIAEVEANAEIMVSAFETIGSVIASTGDTIEGLVDNLESAIEQGQETGDFSASREIKEQLKIQNDLAERQLATQEKLVDSQINLNEAKQRKLESGEAFLEISIDSEIEPDIEQVVIAFANRIKAKGDEVGINWLLDGLDT